MTKLRKFSLSDLNQIMKIEEASFPKRQVYSKSLFEKYYRKCPEGFIVAENRNKIVGYTIGRVRDGSGEIISLAVKPDLRQKGVGTKLTNSLINLFKKKGAKEIFLNVRTENKTAIAFYRKFDFKILRTIKNYYQNGDDAYLMNKRFKGA